MKTVVALAVLMGCMGVAYAAAEPVITFRTVEVMGEKVSLTDKQYVEDGKIVSCQQYVKAFAQDPADGKKTIKVGEHCQTAKQI